MNKYLLSALAISLLGVTYFQQSNSNSQFLQSDNERPIIGIFTQPSLWSLYDSSNYTYIAASYVKFIEQSGARVVPIPYEADNSTLKLIFESINGILIPGGDAAILGPSVFTKSISYMLELAMKSNDDGDIFPIMAVCLGHQAIFYILSDYDDNTLIAVDGEEGILHPIQNAKRSSFFYKDMDFDLFSQFTTQNISYYSHHWAVSPNLLIKHQKLNDMMEITGVNSDINNQTYIASSQAKKYPIYTTQYHSEKNVYEWEIPANHSQTAIEVTNVHSKAFVSQARKNHHKYDSLQREQSDMIYNNPVVHIKNGSFTEIYFIKRLDLSTKQ